MANRPAFTLTAEGVSETLYQFHWDSGRDLPNWSQLSWRRNIASLHRAIQAETGIPETLMLDISSKSPEPHGVALSAFNLKTPFGGTVETVYQGSKVFRNGGPFGDLFGKSPWEAKRDPRLRSSGPLTGFRLNGIDWPLEPKTAFYDWLYMTSLRHNPELAAKLSVYTVFTDIAFAPGRSLACQARAAAQYAWMEQHSSPGSPGSPETMLESRDSFLKALAA